MNEKELKHIVNLAEAIPIVNKKLREVYDDEAYAVVPERCESCKGTGIVTHWFWEDYFNSGKSIDDLDALNTTLHRCGYSRHEPPPKEVACDCCHGRGKVMKQVAMSDLLISLLGALEEEYA